MQDISSVSINLDSDYVVSHRPEIREFFYGYKQVLNNDFSRLIGNINNNLKFNHLGSLTFKFKDLSENEKKALYYIENSYFGIPYFKKQGDSLYSRGHVYYISGIDDTYENKLIRLISTLEVSLNLVEKLYNERLITKLPMMVLLDDIRYKMLILFELTLTHDSKKIFQIQFENLLSKIVDQYYSTMCGEVAILPMLDLVHESKKLVWNFSLFQSQEIETSAVLRSYKEADNPYLNYLFLEKLKTEANKRINHLIGIRFGGIELPFLANSLFPKATRSFVKLSNYSTHESIINFEENKIKGKNVLILDDNVLTGRTLEKLVIEVKKAKPLNIFFACLSYSGTKRIKQMEMVDHGIINPIVLSRSCILHESKYTKISSTESYKNTNGVFDKIRYGIQQSLRHPSFNFKI